MANIKKTVVFAKNARKSNGYTACYTYSTGQFTQYVYVKYSDDVEAIDLLLSKGYLAQAIVIANSSYNKFTDVKR